MLDSARVLSTTSPRGVAPPVSDDCAPNGQHLVACATSDATSASLSGERNAGREAARHVCGIAQERRQESLRLCRCAAAAPAAPPRLDAMSQR